MKIRTLSGVTAELTAPADRIVRQQYRVLRRFDVPRDVVRSAVVALILTGYTAGAYAVADHLAGPR